ncbi:RNA dependent RNA polymerase-domain-containing protein [Aspergillus varians]
MAPPKLSSFSRILQSEFLTSDSRWSYEVRDLPGPHATNPGRWIKSLELVSNANTRKLELKLSKMEPNRATTAQSLDHLLHFSFADFRLGRWEEGKWQTFTARETGDYLVRLLKEGIKLNGILYSFYGHSSSQLRSRSCYLLRGSKDEVAQLVESLGNFSKIKTVAKKAKRIGLLFSSCHALMNVPEERFEDIDDVERSGYNFTDGCGLIGPNAAKLLSQKLSIISRNARYHPSVFQIRFKGYKGVVTLEPAMPKARWFQFRHSMRKFSGTADPSFAVVEYSKPYTYGYLNDDIVLLLSALGISTDVLLKKQEAHFRRLRECLTDPSRAFNFLCSLDRVDLAEKVVLHGIEQVSAPLRGLVAAEYKKMINKREAQKCRILVPESRLLFGVCDPREILEEGECFIRVTDDSNGGFPITISGCEVLVTRNPCLHPGDLRKLRAVDRPQLSHLKDCVVFSVKGDRPAADQMSGGDLDGDTFFVCWDSDLIPSTLSEAAQYPPGRPPVTFDKITVDDRIDYFARSTSISLGRVKSLFLDWAIRKEDGALSSECQELNRLHSLSVDGNRIKIDDRFTKLPPLKDEVKDSFVLNILHREAEKESQQRVAARSSWESFDSREVIETILCQPRSCSEFHMMRLVYEWCRRTREAEFGELLPYFNLDALTVEQQHWLLQELPATTGLPELVMNALVSSDILQPYELRPFHFDHPGMRWKRIFSTENRLANLFEALEKSFPQFHRKLLVLRIHERFSIAVYIPQPLIMDEEALVGTSVRVFAFPHTQHQGNASERIHITSGEYRLHFNHTTLQLYNRQRGNTFIWIGRPGNNDSSFRRVKGTANRARQRHQTLVEGVNHDWVASIALDRFSQNIRTQIGAVRRQGIAAAELYVISNNDVHSFKTLDLWLRSIDTLEITPLFEKVPPPLVISKISTADWTSQPEEIQALIGKGDLSQLDQISMQSKIVPVLQFCFEHNEPNSPGKIYRHYLARDTINEWLAPRELLDGLLQGLLYTPGNVIFFSRLCPWEENLPDGLCRSLKSQVPRLLHSVLQSASSIGDFAIEALRTIAHEADHLSFTSFRGLVEKAGLLLRAPGQMLDISLECLQPASERLLDESPSAKAYFTRNLFGIAIDHNEEAWGAKPPRDDLWAFQPVSLSLTYPVLTSNRRIDAPQLERLAAGDHVRFELARYPENVFLTGLPSFDAVIESSQPGTVIFGCLSYPPSYVASARWRMKHCGSNVTTKAMMDALVTLMEEKTNACALYPLLVHGHWDQGVSQDQSGYESVEALNECQNQAVKASLESRLTCIWGPPGTGKTQTVAAILQELLRRRPEERILVTAPTHNAVDNILKRYLKFAGSLGVKPLRVSTNIHKVSPDLIQYTCDGMDRNEANSASSAKRLAVERIQQARLVFTTCAGAGLGLLRKEQFQIVLIDESSQQTEPMSLIPLAKGCQRAILVGDHVQLRATIGKYAQTMGLEVSLFERLYATGDDGATNSALSKVMLNVQYRMHPQICEFPSREFYDGKLQADFSCLDRPLPSDGFPWPRRTDVADTADAPLARCIFVPCLGSEDAGYQSKGNASQAELCKKVYRLLAASQSTTASIAVLTPYTRQAKILQDALPPSATVSSIDGFQGREADIIIYVTVRCNPHGEIGFLSDLRRLNVVLTRARAGLIVIGCPRTLTQGPASGMGHTGIEGKVNSLDGDSGENGVNQAVDKDSAPVWRRLVASLQQVEIA